jgi:putative ABC transport system permease protein
MNVTPGENMRMAFGAIWVHRFRSLLTILGIVIGITTVITVASLLTGLRKGVVTFFEEFGPDNMFVFKTSGDPNRTQVSEKEARRRPIRPEYAAIIKRWSVSVEDTGVQLYIPSVMQNRPLVARVPGFESDNLSLAGVSPNMATISPRELREGRYFTADEDARAARVAMLGANLAETLFPSGTAVGERFMLDGAEYTVLGVFEKAKEDSSERTAWTGR